MKRLLIICCLFLVGISNQVKASVGLGSQLSYGQVSPDVWQVGYILVQDCSATPPPTTLNLEISATGCSQTRVVSLIRQQYTSLVTGPYCSGSSSSYCGIAGENAKLYNYFVIVNFTTAEKTCTNGVFLRVNDPNLQRAVTANITGAGGFNNEAFLNVNAVNNLNGVNSSPFLAPGRIPILSFIENTQVAFSASGLDFDSDSIAYRLVSASQGFNIPVVYKGGYSSQLPLPSSSGFNLNQVTGVFKFTAPTFVTGTGIPRNQGNNRYTVVFEMKEYRKVGGVMFQIGATRSEMMFEIEPLTGNSLPQVTNFTLNGQPFSPDQPLYIPVGQQSIIEFKTTDPDSLDVLNLELIWDKYPANGSIVVKYIPGHRQEVKITWTPTQAESLRPSFNFYMIVADNSCPIKGITYKNLEVKVANPTGLRPQIDPDLKFKIFPNPIHDEVTFQMENASRTNSEIVIFNVLGQEIDRIRLNDTTYEIKWLQAGKFPAGQYVARLLGKDPVQTIKFLKLQ